MSHLRITSEPRRLGASSLSVFPLGWGMWRFAGDDVAASRAKIDAALEIGITFFDTADIYGPDNGEPFGAAEALLGRVLAADKSLRDKMVLATKAGIVIGTPYDSRADYLVAACEASLRRMGVERVELFQIHRPDILTHPAEVASALERLRTAGKIAEAGVSNHTPAQTRALQAHLPFKLAATQPELSPLYIGALEDGTLDLAQELGLGVLAWSPLARGLLAGDGAGHTQGAAVVAALDALAVREGVSRSAVAYAWVMAHPAQPVALVGTQTPARIREARDALRVKLDRADWYRVLVAARGTPLP